MRPVTLYPAPPLNASVEKKVDWCIKAIQAIALASKTADPNVVADGYTVSNVTETRALDADAVTLDEVADVVGTFIQDLKRRGQKRTG